MKRYQFLKTARGSHDGLKVTTFNKGGVYELSDDLAEQFFEQGLIKETSEKPEKPKAEKPAPAMTLESLGLEELVTLARDKHGLNVDSTMSEADLRAAIETARAKPQNRETKVIEPDETKPAKDAETKKPGRKPL